MNDDCNGDKEADFVSALPDYAQVFMFLRQFGHMLALPPVSLSELESFFLTQHNEEEDVVVGVHWKLLISAMLIRRESRKDWKKMATRFALRSGLISHPVPYSEIPVARRVQLFKLACEAQFDSNLSFKAELKKVELVSTKPIGSDHQGQRYWLLQDSMYDVRLYRESGYDVQPPEGSSWALLARSLDELDVRIADLARKSHRAGENKEKGESEMDVDATKRDKEERERPSVIQPATPHTKREGKKKRVRAKRALVEEGGCLVCGLDNDYQNMLLCDFCEGECHMYCHYPRLWSVPRGKWECPICDEKALVQRLREAHTQLAAAQHQLEKATERKQKSVMRLQRTGLLLQNIILSDSGTERTRRARKVVNYAELNDVYLPPLSPSDFTTSTVQPGRAKPSVEKPAYCVGTRASRRLRELTGELEQYPVQEGEERVADSQPSSAAETIKHSPILSQETCKEPWLSGEAEASMADIVGDDIGAEATSVLTYKQNDSFMMAEGDEPKSSSSQEERKESDSLGLMSEVRPTLPVLETVRSNNVCSHSHILSNGMTD